MGCLVRELNYGSVDEETQDSCSIRDGKELLQHNGGRESVDQGRC